ncbi:histidine kinase [Agrococcus terreus]|uniref:sensor histidine kinase n=1 Tax=Agrococcus terreus TaxID=574649 RepID=UPI00384FF178
MAAPAPLDAWVLPRIRYSSTAGDVAVAALLLVVGGGLTIGGGTPAPDPTLPLGEPWAPWAVVVAAALATLLKRRAPLLAIALLGALLLVDAAWVSGALPLVPLLALLDAVYAAMLHPAARARRAVLVAAAALALALLLLARPGTPADAVQLAAMLAMLLGTPALWGTSVRQRDELLGAERERVAAVAAAGEAARAAALREERAAMARELHDELAARLSAIALQTGALEAREHADAATAGSIAAVRRSSIEALTELRQLIDVLGDDRDAAGARVAARIEDADALAADAERFGVDLDARVAVGAGVLESTASHALARIAREAVANAARHAPGVPVRLRVDDLGERGVELRVENRIAAQAAETGGNGLGIPLMRERWTLAGGEGEAGPVGDGRWLVRARVPSAAAAGPFHEQVGATHRGPAPAGAAA